MSLQTETIEVTGLPVGTTDALEQIGRERGKSAEELVREMIQAEIQAASSFDEILAPIRQGFKESGLSEEEIDELFKETRYVNLAVAVDADFIVSRDTDLLDLMTGHSDECKEFRQRFRNLKVIQPLEFLAQIARSRNLS